MSVGAAFAWSSAISKRIQPDGVAHAARRVPILRKFAITAAIAAGLLGPIAGATDPQTFVYKRVGDLEIKADVYRPEGVGGLRPVLVWIHGGALMSGRRESAAGHPLKEAVLAHGGVVVSIDYRLAPETKLPEIIGDVEDAFRWLRESGPELFAADPERVVVAGSSAGGYLALVSGYRVHPRPRAIVSYWGYGDLIGEWYSKPSTHARHQRIFLSRDEAYALVSGPPVSNASDRPGQGGAKFYEHCRQHGIWPREVSGGWDPVDDTEKFFPFMPLKNVTKDFPPTLLMHGMKDTDVPVENSVLMAAALKEHGVEHRLITDPDADHGSNWSEQARAAIHRAALEFVLSHW